MIGRRRWARPQVRRHVPGVWRVTCAGTLIGYYDTHLGALAAATAWARFEARR